MGLRIILTVFCLIATAISFKVERYENAKIELEEYIEQKRGEINQRYRLHYHVAGPVGWINDPNGFSMYKGKYHLFYQFYPYDSVWGPMHWGHVTSTDLVTWEQLPTALLPEEEQCFSGSAIVVDDTMILMYTAHVNLEDWDFYEDQYLAMSNDGVNYDKYKGNPVLKTGPNGSRDFRDPKVWKHDDHYYMVLGTKTPDDRGAVNLYSSKDMIDWEFVTSLIESNGDLGYMLECPDFFELDGKFVLIMSPQGMDPEGDRYKNTHQTGYVIGSFDYESFKFVPEVPFQEMDYGHDFYAAQTTGDDGKRHVVGWFNMWDMPHPEAVDGWCGALTLVRELSISNNRIIMKPVEAMVNLRDGVVANGAWQPNDPLIFNKTGEIIVEGSLENAITLQFEGTEGGAKAWVRWVRETGKIVVDRGNYDVRQVVWEPRGSRSLRIFLDASSLELFCGEGEAVFSSRVFPEGGWKVTNLSPQVLNVQAYSLKRSVEVVASSSSSSHQPQNIHIFLFTLILLYTIWLC